MTVKSFLLALIFSFSIPASAKAANITVNPGQSIQTAVNSAASGDTIIVNAGTYNERVNIAKSNLTLQAQGQAITKGFNINNANYVTVRGFEVADAIGKGIEVLGKNCVIENNYIHFASDGGILIKVLDTMVDGTVIVDHESSSQITVKNNRIYRNAQVGIDVRGRNHVIEGNEVWGTIQHHPNRVPSPSWADADGMHFHGSDHVFKNNYIHDIKFDGVEVVDAHIDCFQTFKILPYQEAASNITFEGNTCIIPEYYAANAHTNAFMLDQAGNLTIKNNLVHAYGGINTGGGGNHDLTIMNNTWIGFTDQTQLQNCQVGLECWPGGIGLQNTPNVTIKNNIFYDHLYAPVTVDSASIPSLVHSNNLMYRSDGQNWPASHIISSTGELWKVDPKFVNPGGGDYHLQAGSPACAGGENGTYIGAYLCAGGAGTASPSPAAKAGDASGDGKVDGVDYIIWLNNYLKTGCNNSTCGDFNNDAKVDGVDYIVWLNNYGQ